jgi:hypothetical protein
LHQNVSDNEAVAGLKALDLTPARYGEAAAAGVNIKDLEARPRARVIGKSVIGVAVWQATMEGMSEK